MPLKNVIIVHDRVDETSSKDALDALEQARAVSTALAQLGFAPHVLPFSLDIPGFMREARALKPLFAFNLVESVEGDGRLIHLGPSIFDAMGLPYSGGPAEAVFITSGKLLTKKLLRGHGIDTPEWYAAGGESGSLAPDRGGRIILKPVWEHASIGMDEGCVLDGADAPGLPGILSERKTRTGREYFAERFIDGREFNAAILAGELLAVPEIRFTDYPEGKLKVVDYRAKWDEDSFEYSHTPRSFDFTEEDEPLLARLRETALKCWKVFGLRGYARVDFRVDAGGRPWVLEINVNPCISPDAGFFAAAQRAGLSFTQVVKRIIDEIDFS